MKVILKILIPCLLVIALGACVPRPAVVPVKVKAQPGPEDTLFLKAENKIQQGAYEEALGLYNEYLLRYPDRPAAEAALMNMGAIYSAMGYPAESARSFERLIKDYPKSSFVPDAKVQLLILLYKEGKYTQLIKTAASLDESRISSGHIVQIQLLVADAYMASGFPADAVYFYIKAYENTSAQEKTAVIEKLKTAAAKLNASDIAALLNLLNQKPSERCYTYRLGVIFNDIDRKGSAVSVLSEYIKRCPNDIHVYDAKRLIEGINQTAAVYELDTIGCALPRSGPYKEVGDRALKGIELALATFGNTSDHTGVKIIIEDTGADAESATHAVRALAGSNAAAIIGQFVEAKAAAIEAQDRGIPMIALTQKDDVASQGDFIFRNFFSKSMQVKAIVSYATDTLNCKKFAVLYPDENYGSTLMNLFWDEVIASGGQVVSIESYNPSQTDFTDSVKKLVGLYYDVPGRRRNPETDEPAPVVDFDMVFIPDSPNKAALIMPQLAYYDVENAYVFGTNLWHSQQLIDMAGRYVQGAFIIDGFFDKSESEEVKEFVRAFEATYGETPGFIEAVSYDTAMMLLELISRPDIDSRSELMFEIKKVKNYKGVTGLTSFEETGDVKKKFYLLQIKGEEFVQIEQ